MVSSNMEDRKTGTDNDIRGPLNEWHTLAVGLLGALVTGFIYCFSVYSNALKDALHLSESQLETIGMAAPISNLITFTNGLIMDRTSVPFCCVLGGCIMAFAYTVFGLVGLQIIKMNDSATAEWVCFALGALGNYGASFMVAGVFSTLAKNFSRQRSSVISVGKCWVGVASGVGTAIYVGFVPGEGESRIYFLFFVAAICGIVPILISPVLKPIPEERRSLKALMVPKKVRLPLAYGISLVLIATTLLSSAFNQNIGFAIVLIFLLLSPLVLIIPSSSTVDSPEHQQVALAEQDEQPLPESPWKCGPGGMIQRLDFYLLWLATFAIQSGGLFLTVNSGSMVKSAFGDDHPALTAATVVTIFSCFQGLARLVTGLISDWLVSRGLPRTIYFVLLTALMACAHAVLSLPGPTAMIIGQALGGIAFGSVYPLLVLVIAEVYGRERVASNYMVFDGTPGAVGTLLIAKLLAGSIYRAHADPDGDCYGDDCYRLSHLCIVAVECAGCLLSLLLACRTRVVYNHLAGGA